MAKSNQKENTTINTQQPHCREVGQTVYAKIEGEFQDGYWISVKNEDSSRPPLRGVLFKEEAFNMNYESSISANMMGMAATGSLGTGYGNPSASLGMNNVPYVVTISQGMNHASLEKWKNIFEEINLRRPAPGALMAPPHLGSGTSMAFYFDKLFEEVIEKIKVGPHFDKLVDGVLKAINLKRLSPGALMAPPHIGIGTSMAFDFDKLFEEVIEKIKVGPHFDKLVGGVLKVINSHPDFVAGRETMGKSSSGNRLTRNGTSMAPPHLGSGTSMDFDFEKLVEEFIEKIKVGPHFDKLVVGVLKAINARPDFVAGRETMGKSSSSNELNENVIDLEKVEGHTPKKTLQLFPPLHSESHTRRTKFIQVGPHFDKLVGGVLKAINSHPDFVAGRETMGKSSSGNRLNENGTSMAPPHLGSGTNMDFDFEKLVEEFIEKIKVGPHFDKLVVGVLKAISARLDFMAGRETMGKSSSSNELNENVIDLEKVEGHTPKKTLQLFPPLHSESPSKRTKFIQDETNEELEKQNK